MFRASLTFSLYKPSRRDHAIVAGVPPGAELGKPPSPGYETTGAAAEDVFDFAATSAAVWTSPPSRSSTGAAPPTPPEPAGVPRWQLGTMEQAGWEMFICRPLRPYICFLLLDNTTRFRLMNCWICDPFVCNIRIFSYMSCYMFLCRRVMQCASCSTSLDLCTIHGSDV